MDLPMPDRTPPRRGPLPAAVLRHEGGQAGTHFDVMLAVREPLGPDDAACATWRSAVDPADAPPGEGLPVEPLLPHRAEYLLLDLPRDLGQGRGTVVPVRRGTWDRGAAGEIEFRWEDGSRTRIVHESIRLWRRCGP